MMAQGDIRLWFNSTLWEGDFLFADNDLTMDEGLIPAVYMSLFTDRRARDDDELPDPDGSKRGFWGDQYLDHAGDREGSRLWLLEREKTETNVLRRAEEYCDEGLLWMVEDALATKIINTAERQGPAGNDRLALHNGIYRKSGRLVSLRWEVAWQETVDNIGSYQ